MKSKSVQLRNAAPGVAGTPSKRAGTPTRVSRRTQLLEPSPRLLTAVPICDGHDSAINTINLEFIHCGIEVVYLGYHRSARDIVRAATQEDVRAIGLSSYNGGHVEFFTEVVDLLKRQGADDIGVFGGGGGTITKADAAIMQKKGVDRIFFAGTPLSETAHRWFIPRTIASSCAVSPRGVRPGVCRRRRGAVCDCSNAAVSIACLLKPWALARKLLRLA